MKNIKSVLFPCLLSIVTSVSFFCVYEEMLPFPISLIFLANAALFIICERLRLHNKTWLTSIVIIAILFAAVTLAGMLVQLQGRGTYMYFSDWFFKTGERALDFPFFAAALMAVYTPFIAMTLFYFTNVRYNPFFLMLACMTTFALYAKTFTEIPFIFPTLIITIFLFISVEKRWYKTSYKALSYRKFVLSGVGFVALSAYIAGLIPLAESTPYRQQFDDLISGGMTRVSGFAGIGIVFDSDNSGIAARTDNDEELLFVVAFDPENDVKTYPQYLRRQVFDNWTGQSWKHYDDDTWTGKRMSNPDFDVYKPDNVATVTVITDAPIWLLPTPPNAAAVSYPETRLQGRETPSKTIRGEFFIDEDNRSQKEGVIYKVGYFSNTLETLWNITDWYPDIHDNYLDSCLALDDYPNAEKVRQLADEITKDCLTVPEKAKAIEQYFYNGEFVYDLNFAPASKAVDYFLFESKRGTCSDFATAMVILAREAGIHARYTEGFVLDENYTSSEIEVETVNGEEVVREVEREVDGVFLIRTKHSHAFPEIFIKNVGWTIYEPTIPADEYGKESDFNYSVIVTVLLSIGGAGIAAVLFLIFAVPRIKESRFRQTALKSPREKQVQLIYNKIYSEFMKKLEVRERTLSSRDLDSLADSRYGVNLCALTENYDRIVYGGIPAGDGDFFGTYITFAEAVKKS
ncbi:MAG: DUF3488 and transglutaminase-like domain-containing protein [Oscillospiraceae bacterium]|nr:DUF3488 and transglutaminase-like domain-containing protein [Oscillospiraceae bacterium]